MIVSDSLRRQRLTRLPKPASCQSNRLQNLLQKLRKNSHYINVNYLLTLYTACEESKGCGLKCGKHRAVTNYTNRFRNQSYKMVSEATAGSGLHEVPPKLDVAATRQHTFPRQDKQFFFPRNARNMHIIMFYLIRQLLPMPTVWLEN